MERVVLVTGVSRGFGGRVARRLGVDPQVRRVVGVDVVPPPAPLDDVTFVRADIRNPVIAKVIAAHGVDTVVHLSVASSSERGGEWGVAGRGAAKEHNVIGSMQLLAACQRAPEVRRLVVKSSAAVYGSSSRDPAMFTEDMTAKRLPRAGYDRDVLEVEGYVRGFARRRPDVGVTVLRAADVLGPTVTSPLTEYFRLPVLPTVLGYDARLQFLHEADLVDVLHHATLQDVSGTFNVAGDGVLMLSQAARRLGRATIGVPGFAFDAVAEATRQVGLTRLPSGLGGYLTYGRGVDTSRMSSVLGFRPAYSTPEAFADFARTVTWPAGPDPAARPPVASRLGDRRG